MKKTNKENPITFFRKANEARESKVKNSIKKAKYGISMGEDPENMMINKPGSKGGYKKPYQVPYDETIPLMDRVKMIGMEGIPSKDTRLEAHGVSDRPGYYQLKVGKKKLFKKRPIIELTQPQIIKYMTQEKKGGSVKSKKK